MLEPEAVSISAIFGFDINSKLCNEDDIGTCYQLEHNWLPKHQWIRGHHDGELLKNFNIVIMVEDVKGIIYEENGRNAISDCKR